jgi:hypothetical protein
MRLDKELISLALDGFSGSNAWKQKDAATAINTISNQIIAITAGQVWQIHGPEKNRSNQLKDKRGRVGAYAWSVKQKEGEPWKEYVRRSAKESIQIIEKFNADEFIKEDGDDFYFNLEWKERHIDKIAVRLKDLNDEDKAVIWSCLQVVASSKVIELDWEFPLTFGLEIPEFLEVVHAWPKVDDIDLNVYLAINNAMNNLLGYPHLAHDSWDKFIPVSAERIYEVFSRWRGIDIENYFEGMG